MTISKNSKERIVTVGINLVASKLNDVDFSLYELERLIDTAGGLVVKSFVQRLDKLHSRYLIGSGKLEKIKIFAETNDIDTIVFDDVLAPAQQRNLEDFLDIKVIDRTHLILDIFALHARTKESKLQIELAQLNYTLPRLTGKGIALSRQTGGIGTRGPGEKKLEVDLRRINDRIAKIKSDLKKIESSREVNRSQRTKNNIPLVAIVGYTNAGKSSLMKRLTGQDIYTEDQLFATLDTQIKRFELPNMQKILLLDTVGFVQKLPHELVAAFRSTLEEIREADLILHLIDISIHHYDYQRQSVYKVLEEIGVKDIPMIEIYNKLDLFEHKTTVQQDMIAISCKEKLGFKKLLFEIISFLGKNMVNIDLTIPYQDAHILDRIYDEGIVNSKNYEEDKIVVNVDVKPELRDKLVRFLTEK